jgi:light-regulated signal transduction histidine kinase (bacteriophytochrome)
MTEQPLNIHAAPDEDASPSPLSEDVAVAETKFDLIVHRHSRRVIAEFERREYEAAEVAAFALQAHRAIDHLRRQKTVIALLESAVTNVRVLTGFDRVMAYRFRHDDTEYLQNMGVGASKSISLLVNGRLWGPKLWPPPWTRTAFGR